MHKIIAIFTLALTLGIAACLLLVQPFPVLHDFPEWMYQGWLLHHLIGGTSDAIAAQYAVAHYPVPNSLSQVAMAALNFLVSPVNAGRLWLLAYFLLAGSVCYGVYRKNGDSLQVLLLTAVIIFGPGFWNGYINFQFALLLFALYLLLDSRRSTDSGGLLLLFSLLLFFSHAAVYVVFLFYTVLKTLTDQLTPVRRRLTLFCCLLPSVILLCWYSTILLTANSAQFDTGMGLSKWVQYKAYTLAKQGPFHNFIQHTGESNLAGFDLFYKFGFAANFVFAALLGLWLLVLTWACVRGKLHQKLRHSVAVLPLVLVVGFSFVVYLLSGSNTFGVVNLGERFLIVAILIVLLTFNCPPLLQKSLAAIAGFFTLYVLIATAMLSIGQLQQYAVERSSDNASLTDYVDDIYANSRHQFFNHRLFIYTDRGLQLQRPEPEILPIDLATSVVRFR